MEFSSFILKLLLLTLNLILVYTLKNLLVVHINFLYETSKLIIILIGLENLNLFTMVLQTVYYSFISQDVQTWDLRTAVCLRHCFDTVQIHRWTFLWESDTLVQCYIVMSLQWCVGTFLEYFSLDSLFINWCQIKRCKS